MGDSSEAEEKQTDPVRRSRRRRKSKRESSGEQCRTEEQSPAQTVHPLVQVHGFRSLIHLTTWGQQNLPYSKTGLSIFQLVVLLIFALMCFL